MSEASTLGAYQTIGPADVEIEIKRSRFLCRLRHAESEAAARAVVDEARAEHWQARHHCSAFVIGPAGDLRRSNDDGEPAGSAGRPMLDVLVRQELSDVVAVVTRYFGGVKLGAAGLARVYADAVAQAVTAAPRVSRILMRGCALAVPHAVAGRVEHVLRREGVNIREVAYGEVATLQLLVPETELPALRKRLAALHVGAERIDTGDVGWHDVG